MRTDNVCTVELSGGLGNQLFQYATARAIALRSDARLLLDLSFYRPGRHRAFELGMLPIHADIVRPSFSKRLLSKLMGPLGRKQAKYREPHFHFDSKVLDLKAPVRIEGYFQSEKYFTDHAETIRRELQFPPANDDDSQRLAELLHMPDSVVMHVRRGDYISNPKASKVFAECTLGYYERAMQQIPGSNSVVVVSDDIDWAEQNLPRVRELVFPSNAANRTALDDLWLMTQSQHNIIANSTFSWWAAWLSERPDSVTVAPHKWFNESDQSDRDLIPDRWLRVE